MFGKFLLPLIPLTMLGSIAFISSSDGVNAIAEHRTSPTSPTISLASPLDGDRALPPSSQSQVPQAPFVSSLERAGFGDLVPTVSWMFSSSLPEQQTIFEDTFSGDLENFKVDSGAAESHGAQIRTAPADAGQALRIEVRSNDPLSNNKHRSEIVPRVDRGAFEYGTDYFYQFRTYLPADWEADDAPEIITQWHGVPDRDLGERFRRPPLALSVQGEQYRITTRSDFSQINDTQNPGETFTEEIPWAFPIDRGRWVDWAFQIRWSYNDRGLIRVWKDGQEILNHEGPNTYNDRIPPYWKLGVYKWVWTRNPQQSDVDRRVMWIDDVSLGILQ